VRRTLKLSSRPFIVFAVLLGPLALWALSNYIRRGFDPHLLTTVMLFPCLYVAILGLICSTRVRVSDEGITVNTWYFLRHFVPFAEIDHSKVQVLAERDWPVYITIYGAERRSPLLTIGLKAIQKADAAWFCSLPALKAVTSAGLTKKA
jgi:hypothetical protein